MNGLSKIGQVAKTHGLTLRTLRFYEDRGLISPKRDRTTRLYSPEDSKRVEFITELTSAGFTLKEIGEIIAAEDPDLKRRKAADTIQKVRRRLSAEHETLVYQARALEKILSKGLW